MTLNDGRRCDPLRSPKFCMQIPEPNSAIAKPTALLSPRSPCSPRSPIGSPISPRIRQRKPTRRDSRRKSEKLFAFSSRNIVSNLNRKVLISFYVNIDIFSQLTSFLFCKNKTELFNDQQRNITGETGRQYLFQTRSNQKLYCLAKSSFCIQSKKYPKVIIFRPGLAIVKY